MVSLRVLWKVILLEVFLVQRGMCGEEEDWALGFSEGFSDCNNFENKVMNAENMQMGISNEEGEEASFLSGFLTLLKPLKKGYMIELQLAKQTEVGNEPMWGYSSDLCEFFKDKESPMYPTFEQMGIKGCPVDTGDYQCEKMTIDVSGLNDFISDQNEGLYTARLEILDDKLNTMTCHKMELSIANRNGRK